MAKSRSGETGRERVPPPPRMTGMGLQQVALIAALGSVIAAAVGGFMAGNQADPSATRHIDEVGAGVVTLLTAHESDSWRAQAGTFGAALKRIKAAFGDELELPSREKKDIDRDSVEDDTLNRRNKDRLANLMQNNPTLFDGMLKGLTIDFKSTRQGTDQRVGARIDTGAVGNAARTLGSGVSVAVVSAKSLEGGTFSARVYHKAYKDAGGTVVGNAYAVFSQQMLDNAGGGGGLWLFLTPLLVAVFAFYVLMQANQAAAGARALARDLDSIGRGKLDLRVNVSANGEVGLAQRQADRMAKNLQLILSTGSGDLDEAIEKELDLANQIHESLRPAEPPRVPGYEIETLFKSGREIGGDYFDYIEIDDNRIALVLADCADSIRGVPAAMVMAMTRAYLKSSIDPATPPSEWLSKTNRRLANDLRSGMAVTALICVLDMESGDVIMASAGHRPAVMWRAGKTATINPNGIALGLDIGPVFEKTIEDKKLTLQKNDRLVLYTDGVISARDETGEEYGETRFVGSIQKQGAMNSAAFVNFVAGGVDKFLGGEEQDDDITISTIKRMK